MAVLENNFVQIVREADIDLLICEELAVSPEFNHWFVEQIVGKSIRPLNVLSVFTHYMDRFGECDILVIADDDGKKIALLIENKIDVDFQPNQALRYLERGRAGIEENQWSSFFCVLIAPDGYSSSHSDASKFHATLTYESIRDWFLEKREARSHWRASILNKGIEQNRKGYVKNPDPRVTALWKSYWAYRAEHFPQIAMPEPGPQGHRNGWPKLGGLFDRDGVKLLHKLPSGCVDLVVMSTAERELAERLTGIDLPRDSMVANTGKSTSIRILVPVVDHQGEFEPQAKAVHAGLEAADRLLGFFNEVGSSRLTGR